MGTLGGDLDFLLSFCVIFSFFSNRLSISGAEGAQWRGISAQRPVVPEDTWLLAPRCFGASSRSSSEPGTPPEPLPHQTEHKNFKMVPGARGLERVAPG